jgi:hypothetical protein
LVERRDIAKHFADWKEDPNLKEAIDQALDWVKRGGKSELTKKRE